MLRLIIPTALLLTLGGMAADASPPVSGSPAANPGETPAASAQPQPTTINVLAANQIIGRDLRDPGGADAGTINSLLIDTHTGVVDFVLVGSSGSFNVGAGVVAVPWLALQPPKSGNDPITTKISADKILQSPRIDPARISELSQPGQRDRLYGYYGYRYPGYYRYGYDYGYGMGLVGGFGLEGGYGRRFAGRDREGAGTFGNQGSPNSAQQNGRDNVPPRDQPVAQNPSGEAGQQSPANPANAQQAGQKTSQNDVGSGSALVVTRSSIISTLDEKGTTSANALQNASVYGRDGENLGDIDEVMIDVNRGEVAYILLSRGGFLGLNQRWYTLPVEALVPAPYQDGYRLTVDARTLLREPAYYIDRQSLPTHVSASQLATLYQQFGMQPYWEQDNQQNTPTPTASEKQGQQSGGKPDGTQ